MMEDTLSKTAQANKLLLEFWSDFQPHSVREFRDYLKKNNIITVGSTHISSAVYTAKHQGVLERVNRGSYQAGINFQKDEAVPMKKTDGIQFVLQQTKRVLSIPISIMDLSPKERELIPRLQELYQECERMLEELERNKDENEASEERDC